MAAGGRMPKHLASPVHFDYGMRLRAASLLAGALIITTIESRLAVSAQDTPDRSVLMLRVVRDIGEEHGTAVVIHRDDRGSNTVLHFLTSSCLFRTPQGEQRPPARTIELLLDEGQQPLEVKRGDVFMPSGSCIDIAVFRVTAPATIALVPQRIIYDPPPAGAAFLASGYDLAGRPTRVAAHIRFRSTLLAIGDRDLSSLRGCVGAAAVLQGGEGVFGVVSECDPNRAPVIALLSVARRFIEQYVPPRDAPSTANTRLFPLQERNGP
jgi:hypothetical protein